MNTKQHLRTLDPSTELTEVQQRRADALLHRIVVQPAETGRQSPARTIRRWPRAWRVGVLLVAGGIIAAVAIAIPELSTQSAAVASWTPEAEAVSAPELAVAERVCRDSVIGTLSPASIPPRSRNVAATLWLCCSTKTLLKHRCHACSTFLKARRARKRSLGVPEGALAGLWSPLTTAL